MTPAGCAKNWLFVGPADAGNRATVLYSLIVSCQRHGHDPHAYLKDVLARLPRMTTKDDLTPLLPASRFPACAPNPAAKPGPERPVEPPHLETVRQ